MSHLLADYKTCGKQYTGKTVDKFRSRRNNYKMDARKAANGSMESCKQQFLQNHFLQDDDHGFLEDVEVTLTDKNQASDPTKREYLLRISSIVGFSVWSWEPDD